MRSKFFIIFLLGCVTSSFAQTQKGDYLIGGTIDLVYRIEADFFNFGAVPNIGYFIIDDLVVGADISTAWSRQENAVEESLDYFSIGATPFIRYYAPITFFDMKPFAEARVGYQYTRFTNRTKQEAGKFYAPNWGGALGIAYFLNQNCALNLMLDYQQSTLKNDLEVMAKNRTWSTQIGVEVFLNRKE